MPVGQFYVKYYARSESWSMYPGMYKLFDKWSVHRSRTNSPRPRGRDGKSKSAKPSDNDVELETLSQNVQIRPTETSDTTVQVPYPNSPGLVEQPDTIEVPPAHSEHWASRFLPVAKVILCYSWINVLLVMVPVAIAVHFANAPAVAQFVTACLAIIPLAALLGFATEELAKRFGNALSALLNISFGNAAELIIFLIGVVRGEIGVVQAAIIGSVLSNLLLILGMAFFLGGLRWTEQFYNNMITQTTGTLLLLAVCSMSIPGAFHASFRDSELADNRVLQLSYSTSILLLVVYGAYLYFQLKTHASLYRDIATGPSNDVATVDLEGNSVDTETLASVVLDEIPQIPLVASIILLAIATALIALIAEFMVSSINGLVATTSISEQFVGLILIPIVGNSAEHYASCMLAMKGRIDLSLGIALGSSLQIVLLVGPLAVIVGWCIGQPLTLFFSLFETLSLLLSVMIVTYIVIDGRSNWLEGVLLMSAYVVFAIAAALYPSAAAEA